MQRALNDNFFMRAAVMQAETALKANEVPVGAVIVYREQLLVASYNNVEQLKDPTAHAEILAIRAASAALQSRHLVECDLYVTLEPCMMCAYAISLARLRRVYFGAYDTHQGACESHKTLSVVSAYVPEVYGGIHEELCSAMIKDFFRKKRVQRA